MHKDAAVFHRFFIFGLLIVGITVFAAVAQPPSADWSAAETAISKGLPQTAIGHLDAIIEEAKSNRRYAEAVKAIAMKASLEGTIEGNKPEAKITRLQAEIEPSPDEMKPALEAILATWYWQYLQQNRWRFLNRTATAAPPGEDFTTWDLPRLLAEIDRHFEAALANPEPLQEIPIAQYDALLEKGNVPDAYRPTLYDALAHTALQFYASGEQVGSRSEDAFQLSADSPIFAARDEFLSWQPKTTEESSITFKAIKLWQELLHFHADDEDPSARWDADLGRLVFGYNRAFGEAKDARYKLLSSGSPQPIGNIRSRREQPIAGQRSSTSRTTGSERGRSLSKA